jgi:hypothetical protein
MFQTYDPVWLDHYTENGYVLRDPMVAWGFSTTGTIRWSDPSLPDPFGLFKKAKAYGLSYGATVACGPIKSRTIASFARSDREFSDHEIATAAAIVHRLHDMTEPPEELTKAQIEGAQMHCRGGPDRSGCGQTGDIGKRAQGEDHLGAHPAHGAHDGRGDPAGKGLSPDVIKTPPARFDCHPT